MQDNNNSMNVPLLANRDDKPGSEIERWVIVFVFVLAGTANAVVLLSWAPIFDQASVYFNGLGSGVATYVNLLFSTFQFAYLPGTLGAIYVQKKYGLRKTLLYGSTLTAAGCLVRWMSAFAFVGGNHDAGTVANYVVIALGTCLVAQAQPVFMNLPTMIALTWFPVTGRDFAMTVLSLANASGSAIGSVIPAMVVQESDTDKDSVAADVTSLMLLQLITGSVSLLLVYFLFLNAPETPPSVAAEQLLAAAVGGSSEARSKSTGSLSEHNGINGNSDGNSTQSLAEALKALLGSSQYVSLLIGFSVAIGSLNTVASLIGQQPTGNTPSQSGLVGFSLILTGFIGALLCGSLLAKYQAYATTLKGTYTLAVIAFVSFMLNTHNDNFTGMCITGALTGFFVLAVVPASLQNAVEATYPISEDITVGLMQLCANLLTIPLTFASQALLAQDKGNANENSTTAYYSSYAWFSTAVLGVGWLSVMLYRPGAYRRLELDTGVAGVSSAADDIAAEDTTMKKENQQRRASRNSVEAQEINII